MFYSNLYKLANKFAALSDEQYKSILRDPKLLQFLDKTNKLDEFYKSMPEVPLTEIEERINRMSKGIAKMKERKLPEEMKVFIDNNGSNQIPIDLLQQIRSNILEDESYSEKESYTYFKYIEDITYSEFLQTYLKSPYYSDLKLKKFLDDYKKYKELLYKESLNERENILLGMLKLDLVKTLVVMMKSIFSTESVETEINNNLIEAERIRKSDDFDFLNDEIIDLSKLEKTDYKDFSKEDKIIYPDYSDEATSATK